MSTNLVICMGNTARGDDGVAHEVARLLRESQLGPALDVRTTGGLDITMAEDVSAAKILVIVDAERRPEPPVLVEPLCAKPNYSPTGHTIDPAGLMTLVSSLYRSMPKAYLVSVAAPQMGHGEGLSETATAAASLAARLVSELISS